MRSYKNVLRYCLSSIYLALQMLFLYKSTTTFSNLTSSCSSS